ncbi:hypothetical protein [Vibrio sp.]|uniref:hypothetical protein n=1 Tax=Vibrio sp. TaxID=678 RepID=UPI0037AC2C9B
MLQRTLIENSWGALHSDPNLAHFSWNYLICPSKDVGEDNAINKAFVDLYVRTIDKRNPGSYRLNELHAIANIKDKAPWESNELPWLESIFDQLMIHEGDVVHYKDSKVHTYSRLAGQIGAMTVSRLVLKWFS